MSIRLKTITTVSVALITLLFVLYISTSSVLMTKYAAFERTRVRQDVARVYQAYLAEVTELEKVVSTRASREETSALFRDEARANTRSLLPLFTFKQLRVHCVVMLDPSGKIIYAQGVNTVGNAFVPVSHDLLSALNRQFDVPRAKGTAWQISGILMLPEGPLLVAGHPVRNIAGVGMGTLVMGRRMDAAMITRLSEASHVPLVGRRYTAPGGADFIGAKRLLSVAAPIVANPLDEKRIGGYLLLTDLAGKPALMMRLITNRDIYRQGQETSHQLLLLFLLIGIACSLIIIRQLDRHVLSRLARLHRDVRQLRDSGSLSARITPLEGGDELTHLSHSVNEMLESMEGSQQEIQRQMALRESETRYRELVELSPDGVFILVDGKCAFANATGIRLLGAAAIEDVLDIPLRENIHPVSDEPTARQAALLFAEEGLPRCEAKLARLDGSTTHVEVAATPCSFQGQPAMQLIAHDITERKRAEERMNYLAYFDALTDIPNRALFNDRLTQAMARAERYHEQLAVLTLDIDRFNDINTIFGYAFGDLVLKSIAVRLTAVIRQYDTVARASGDEFCCILANILEIEEVEAVARRIFETLTQPFILNGQTLHLTPSIGVAMYPADGERDDVLLQNANVALNRAKAQGNTCVFFSQGMEIAVTRKREVEEHLRRGLVRQEFQVYYQPQVDLKRMHVVGVEALLRWNHPEWGLVAPDRFIAVAEETGMIEALDEWVLQTACLQTRAWHKSGFPDLRIACNLSARQFRRGGLVETVTRVLNETGLDPRCLELELTESVAMDHVESTLTILHSLNDLGVRIAIDDFGTGYSSLSYLSKFPVQTLKIDRSFVKDVLHDLDDACIVTAIIRLTHSLKLRALAEGVESEEQLAFLHERQCDEIQGYLIGKPTPADHFTERFLLGQAGSTKPV